MFIEFGSKRIHYNVIITSIYSKYSTPFESRIYQVASCRVPIKGPKGMPTQSNKKPVEIPQSLLV